MTRAMRDLLPALLAALAGALCLVLVSGCGASPSLEASLKFQEARELFEKASAPDEFLAAANLYEQIADQGICSGALFYNLGNAYMQAGRTGHAIAAYRQAKRFRPRDPFLDANLKYALGHKTQQGNGRDLVEYLLFWQDWLSYPEKLLFVVSAGGFSLLIWLTSLFWRGAVFLRRLKPLVLLLTLLLVLSAGFDFYRHDLVRHGVVIKNELVARKGTSTGYEAAFTEPLPEGTEFRMLEKREEWLLIRLARGHEGWIPAKHATLY